MKYSIGWALLLVGVVLLVMGIHSANSLGSSLSRLFTGTPSDTAIWLIVGGLASSVVGAGLMSGRRD